MGDVKNLTSNEAVDKIKELVKAAVTCQFVTKLSEAPLAARPMSTQDVDDEGNIYFFSQKDSEKNDDINEDDRVQLFYTNNSSYEYLSIYGEAEIIIDPALAEKIWSTFAKTWFTEGADDPRLTIIKVKPLDAYYWDTKNNKVVALVKMLAGAITGKTMDDAVQGRILV